MLGYNEVRVEAETAASAVLTCLSPGLRADAKPKQPDIDSSVVALLAKRHRAHWVVRPSVRPRVADCVHVAPTNMVPRQVSLLGPAGALDAAAQRVLERVVASLR